MTALPEIFLKPHEDRRIRTGHLWLFSNEIDDRRSSPGDLEPGQPVKLLDSRGNWLALAYINPHSLICARILSRRRRSGFDRALIHERISNAANLRRLAGRENHCRLVFGESDGLPGLVIDRFGDVFVVQVNTCGMERVTEWIMSVLVELFAPEAIVLKNDSRGRADEGLPLTVETAHGALPARVIAREGANEFVVDVLGGQKTGWFYDQQDNRQFFSSLGPFDQVLDVFSYTGGWSVAAAGAGSSQVRAVDSSRTSLDQLDRNAAGNGFAERIETVKADAFEELESLRTQGRQFDAVVLDPPAFIKRKKSVRSGMEAYRKLNHLGMDATRDGGLLVCCSCSFHAGRDEFLRSIALAGRDAKRSVQVIHEGQQSLDHPLHPAMPETRYLKAFFLKVGERW